MNPTDDLEPFLRQATLPPGWRVHYWSETGSTNDLAREAARLDERDGGVFLTDFQTAGRGRQGRVLLAPPGFGLLFSVLFRSGFGGPPPLRYTMLASVAAAEVLESLGLRPEIKWPNDLLLDGKKVAGILAEAFQVGESFAVVVGCGINVGNLEPLPEGLPDTATTIAAVAGQRPHRGELLVALLHRLAAWRAEPHERLRSAWHQRLWGRDQVIRAQEAGETLVGRVESVDDDGTLVLRLEDGTPRRLVSGEIVL